MSLDETVQITNMPKESGEYKVVQLSLDGQPHLRFAEGDGKFITHAVILMRLFHKLGIKYKEVKARSECDVPSLTGERYSVKGMGKSKIDVEQKKASFYGGSFDYGIWIDNEHLNSMKPLLSDWNIEYRL